MRNNKMEDIKDFIIDHYQYFAVGVLFVILIIVLVVFSVTRKKTSDKSEEPDTEQTSEESSEETVNGSDEIEVPDVKLEQNTHEEINEFFTKYYQAMADGDIDTVASMWSNLDDENKIRFQTKASFTESYDNLSCYTKPGPVDNSYIVFAYYEIKFNNIDTRAPGLSTFYVCTNDNGELYIQDMNSIPDNQKNYITAIANQSDVQDLLTEVDTLYTNNIESDPTLEAFMKSLQVKTDDAVAQAKQAGTQDTGEEGAEAAPEEESSEGVGEVKVTTTDTVNIRAATDQNSEKLGSAAKGDTFVRISEEGEWSKIKYKDGEAYIKSEFLTTASTDGGEAAPAPAEESTDTSSAGGKIKITGDNVNVRSKASTDSDTVGKASSGSTYTLKGEENGWYKIDYNGTDGYVRNDFATKE